MLLNSFRKLFSNSQNRKARRASSRPQLLQLESRIVPATITVLNTAASGAGSLDAAITQANLTAGNDDIVFNTGLTGTITLAATLPTIISASTPITGGGTAGTVTITGPGASTLTISGSDPTNPNNSTRNFNIFTIATGGDLSISGVTVSGAQINIITGNGGAFNNSGTLAVSNSTLSVNTTTHGNGGAIFSSGTGTLTVITNSTLSANSASSSGLGIGGFGGAIYNTGAGTLTVTNSTLSSNTAKSEGGGIYINFTGTLTVSNSTLSSNTAGSSGGGSAGGIFNVGTGTVTNSTLSANYAGNSGGGIRNGGTLTVSNSTLSSNTAAYTAGGIYNTGNLTVTNSTLSSNSAGHPSFLFGGIYNPTGSTLNIANTIIANSTNLASTPAPINDYGGGGTVNLIGTSTNANNIVTQVTSSATSAWATSVLSGALNLEPC